MHYVRHASRVEPARCQRSQPRFPYARGNRTGRTAAARTGRTLSRIVRAAFVGAEGICRRPLMLLRGAKCDAPSLSATYFEWSSRFVASFRGVRVCTGKRLPILFWNFPAESRQEALHSPVHVPLPGTSFDPIHTSELRSNSPGAPLFRPRCARSQAISL